jgi:hypothetical protein
MGSTWGVWHVVFDSPAPNNQTWDDFGFEFPPSLTHGRSEVRVDSRGVTSTKREVIGVRAPHLSRQSLT